jgi:hypothetical protein
MKSKFFPIILLIFSGCAFAQSEQRIQEIATRASVLMQEAGKAANAGDAFTACTKSKEGVLLWYQIDPRAVPSKNIQDFFATDVTVRTMVGMWMNVCGKY